MSRLTILIISLLITSAFSWGYESEFLNSKESPYELTFTPFPAIVQKLGYPLETHKIHTEDGYILTFFRIQAKGNQGMRKDLPVAYLQHGIIDSADSWVINSEPNSLGLRLANDGYDVWCGNSRGNKYSLEHATMKASDHKFWKFSWQNMSVYDLPAAFEYIHKETNQPINYIGHSQGTTIMFAALVDQNPTILKYLKKFIALAPITWVQNISSGPIHLAAQSNVLIKLVEALGLDDFMPASFFVSESGHLICKAFPNQCGNFLSYFFGSSPDFDDYSRYNIFLQHEPCGTSLMGLIHWRQLVLTGRFGRFDYGEAENMRHYGQKKPTDYDLSKITQKVYLFLGSADSIGDLKDQETLLKNLKGENVAHKVYKADHMTWMWSKNIEFYYTDLMNILKGSENIITL